MSVLELVAPAKLTLSLRITGVRSDGYHLLASEMVSLDLADTLEIGPGDGLTVVVRGRGVGCRPCRPARTTWWPGPWWRRVAGRRCGW